ncbi:MAG: acyltransferase [Prevotellaceae bacterium]|jgi:acetyltransferase-like isoleucine patch superfamily enzyme|nr:acyltransferase [Prevotellaceae bacterium]
MKRFLSLLLFFIANNIPMTMRIRPIFYRLAGIDIARGTVYMGVIHCDTWFPQGIHIGSGVTITSGCLLLTHFYDIDKEPHSYYRGEITIGKNVYIATNVLIVKPVSIGDGAVIGAGSVVTKNIPANEVWAGVPAKFIKKRYCKEKYTE